MKALVSIVVPVYNVEKYLRQCLDSIINQTYSEIQIILVDDGSTDSSGMICDEYAGNDTRIEVVHQKNQGLSGARNTGIACSRGEYIIFVDSDDFIDTDMIRTFIDAMEPEVSIVSCGAVLCDEDGKFLHSEHRSQSYKYIGKEQIKAMFHDRAYTVTAWGKLYSRKLFEEVKFPLGKYHEDMYTTYKLVDQSCGTLILDRAMYWYRQVGSSIMHQQFKEKHLDAIEANEIRAQFIQKNYPEFMEEAKASIAYICCKCAEKMISSSCKDRRYRKRILDALRPNLKSLFTVSDYSIRTKAFAVVYSISPAFVQLTFKGYLHMKRRMGKL